MRALGYAALASLPIVILSSCLLPSFENVAASAGGAGSGGMGGEAGAPAGGDAGQAGEAGGGAVPPMPVDDAFTILQGATLSLPAPGVLVNDAGSSLNVSAVDDTNALRPKKYDALALSIDAKGALEFTPQPGFFGTYSLIYTVRDKDGQTAQAAVKINVQPVKAALATVRDGIGGFVINGTGKDGIGAAVAGAGDVNNDGFDDIVIGAPASGDNGSGRAYVVYGRAKPSAVSLKALTATTSEHGYFELDGADGDGAGNSVAGIGDVNGDKFSDFAVAASAGNSTYGSVYIVYGGALTGALPAAGADVVLKGRDVAPIGSMISRAGDVNGDGTPDLLVSGTSLNGRVYAVLGGKNLKSSDIDNLADLLQIDGATPGEGLPVSLDYVGHVDADAKDEVVLASLKSVTMLRGPAGAYPTSTGLVSSDGSKGGWLYGLVLPTTKSNPLTDAVVAGAGNVDGDPDHSADLVICEADTSTPPVQSCRVVFGPPVALDAGWNFSGFTEMPRVAHGADLNGDGFSDVLFADASNVYAVFGKKSGHTPVDVTALGSAGFTLTTESGHRVSSVVTVGDVNGDGAADYAVGDVSASSGAGSVFIVYGSK